MKNTEIVKKITIFDTICIGWSLAWRSLVLIISIAVIPEEIFMTYYGINNMDISKGEILVINIIVIILNIIAATLAIKWMIARKEEGRWIRLEAREEMKSGE